MDLKNGPSLQGIAVLNIPSIYGGSNLWGENPRKTGKKPKKRSIGSHYQSASLVTGVCSCLCGNVYSLQYVQFNNQTIIIIIFNVLFAGSLICNNTNSTYSESGTSINQDLADAIQDIGDRLIEVIGLENCMHMGQVRAGLRASGRRLAQCSSVVIRLVKL